MAVDRIHPNLTSCIHSITQQVYKNMEFLICLDSSDSILRNKLETICNHDARVKITQNSKQRGLAFSLNKLIRFSQGDLIVRMDDDDLSTQFRLKTLVDAHKRYPQSLIIGSCAQSMKNSGKEISVPLTTSAIRNLPINKTRFLHPTVSFKRQFFRMVGFYDTNFKRLQDKDLWERACLHEIEFRNLSVNLIYYNDFHGQKPFSTLFDRWKSKLLFCQKHKINNKWSILIKSVLIDIYYKIRCLEKFLS